jgi:hypothetical protein
MFLRNEKAAVKKAEHNAHMAKLKAQRAKMSAKTKEERASAKREIDLRNKQAE